MSSRLANVQREPAAPQSLFQGPGGQRWGNRPTFVTLKARHADFHRAAGNVARRINDGRRDEAEQLIGSGSAFSQLSTEVTLLLTRARRGQ
ncbi:MAG: hypothetical protein ACOZD0_06905 [Pseudomonadota bacterium]